MMDAAGLVGLGSVWTVCLLWAGYRFGYQAGQTETELEAKDSIIGALSSPDDEVGES